MLNRRLFNISIGVLKGKKPRQLQCGHRRGVNVNGIACKSWSVDGFVMDMVGFVTKINDV